MKKLVLGLLTLTFVSFSAFADDCILLIKDKPTDYLVDALKTKGYRLTMNPSLVKRVFVLEIEEIEGAYKEGNLLPRCFGRYEKSTLTITLKISSLDNSDYIESTISSVGNAKYRLPCAYPQVQSADAIAERRADRATIEAFDEALKKLKSCI